MSSNRKIGVDRDFQNNQVLNMVVETVTQLPDSRTEGSLIYVESTGAGLNGKPPGKIFLRTGSEWLPLTNEHKIKISTDDVNPGFLVDKVVGKGVTPTEIKVGDTEKLQIENTYIGIDTMDDVDKDTTGRVSTDGIFIWDPTADKYSRASLGTGFELVYLENVGGVDGQNHYELRLFTAVRNNAVEHTFNMMGDITAGIYPAMFVYSDPNISKKFAGLMAWCATGSANVQVMETVPNGTQEWITGASTSASNSNNVSYTELGTYYEMPNKTRLDIQVSGASADCTHLIVTMVLVAESRK